MIWYTVVDVCADRDLYALRILCLLIISAATTDAQACTTAASFVNRTDFSLEWLLEVPKEELVSLLKPAGRQHVNCSNMKAMAKIIKEKWGGKLPMVLSELLTLPGVFTKTASLTIKQVTKKTVAIAMDRHLMSWARFLRWIPSDTKDSELARYILERRFPHMLWSDMNEVIGSLTQLFRVRSNWGAIREVARMDIYSTVREEILELAGMYQSGHGSKQSPSKEDAYLSERKRRAMLEKETTLQEQFPAISNREAIAKRETPKKSESPQQKKSQSLTPLAGLKEPPPASVGAKKRQSKAKYPIRPPPANRGVGGSMSPPAITAPSSLHLPLLVTPILLP